MTTTLIEAGRKGGNSFKHRWTEGERNIVRRDYRGTRASAAQIAANLSHLTGERITLYAVIGVVQRLGIAANKSRHWTPEEEERLAELITRYAPISVARRLHRSVNAVVVKAGRLGVSRRTRDGWFTKQDVCELFGVDHKKAQRWIDSGELRAAYHTETKPRRNGGACWEIKAEALREFLLTHTLELQGRNVDLFQIVNLLAGESIGTGI